MLDFGLFEIRTDIFVLIVSVVFLLIQLLLCFKVKQMWIRLLPLLLFFVLTVGFAVTSLFLEDWDRFGVAVLALFSAFPLVACGVGFGVWWIVSRRKRNQHNK
mgnify:CR=1 FL=1|jgi:hypothetical protein